jgi:hypothetical protein
MIKYIQFGKISWPFHGLCSTRANLIKAIYGQLTHF